MRVEVIRAYGDYPRGHVIPEMPANQARMLIERGLVRELPNHDRGRGQRHMAAPVDRMVRAGQAQRRRT